MNTHILRIALGVGLLSSFSLSAAATPNMMAELDLNGDTAIDRTEFLSAANQKFSAMDANADGVVTKDERRAFRLLKREELAQKRFAKTDANADGFISQQEYDAARAERAEYHKSLRSERHNLHASTAENRGGEYGERTRFRPDANGDGVVDVAEHTTAAEHKFARLDKDGNGVLSQDELNSGKRHVRKRRRGHGNDGIGR